MSEPIKPATAPATDEQLKIWQERPCGDTQCRCTELHLDQAIARIQSDAAKIKALELEHRAAYNCDHQSAYDDCELCDEAMAIKARQS